MAVRSALALLGLLVASCAVRGFSIVDELPGSSGGSGGAGAAAGVASGAGSGNRGGDSAAGTTAQGGAPGSAGSLTEAGSPSSDAGEPGVAQGGAGDGGAPSTIVDPCAQSNGLPPLLCDDFETGALSTDKWTPPAGQGVMSDVGPHGPTKLVHLVGPVLETMVGDFPLSEAAGEVTLSFWLKPQTSINGAVLFSFKDRNFPASSLRVTLVQSELGFRSSTNNVFVPEMPTQATLIADKWTCVSLHLTSRSMTLSYQVEGFAVHTLLVDEEPTAGIDTNWQQMELGHRFVSGYPSFGGIYDAVPTEMSIDDVRLASDTSSVCPF